MEIILYIAWSRPIVQGRSVPVCVVVVAPPSGWWEVKCDVVVPASAQTNQKTACIVQPFGLNSTT